MKSIAKFLLAVFSFAPVTVSAAPVSTTAGSNLTGYNGAMGSVVGNQWNNATNPRQNNTSAKADFGNCNALVLRCASPRCAGGGCSDMEVAKAIVTGCVNSNTTCKKHGDALITAIAGQLVADSVATANQQAANQAAAAEQNAQQMQMMQQQMSQQMQMMQEQNNAQIAALQNALEESRRETTEAVQNAAANAAANVAANSSSYVDGDTGLTRNQEIAAKSGVSEDVISRATITGQILTSMEGVDTSLNNLKTTMREAFKYGGCNEINGNNCTGPKRIAKFRELAYKFFEPYEALSDNLEDALYKAQSVGVDLGNIYMFFSGSCNRWAEYVCRGEIVNQYVQSGKTVVKMKKRDTPYVSVISQNVSLQELANYDFVEETVTIGNCSADGKSIPGNGIRGGHECYNGQTIPPEDLVACTVNKFLDPEKDEDKVSESVLNPETSRDGSVRVGCASDLSSGFIKRRSSSSKNKSGIDIDLLEILITQDEGGTKFDNATEMCGIGNIADVDNAITALKAATVSKTLKYGNGACCEETATSCNVSCYDLSKDVSYVHPIFALCDTHAWNAGLATNDKLEYSDNKNKMNEIIGLKTTVVAQQLYKQYVTLEKMIKQLKIMLEKEVLKAQLQVAGASDDGNYDNESLSAEFSTCSAFDDESALSCLKENYSKLQPIVEKGRLNDKYKKQLEKDCKVLKSVLPDNGDNKSQCNCDSKTMGTQSKMQTCLDNIAGDINRLNKQIKKNSSSSGGFTFGIVPTN